MKIAIIAHDAKKELMVQFCSAYCGILSKHTLCATSTTGKQVSEATGLEIKRYLSGRGSRVRRGHHVRRRGRHSQRRGPAGKSIKIPPVPTFSERAEKFTAGRNTRPAGRFVKSESPGCPR